MTLQRVEIVKPGFFATAAAADSRRGEFDLGNEVLIAHKVPVDFVFIGDSITHMWELNAYFGRDGRYIVNRGIGGDISSHVLRRFEADVIQLKPKVVVIKIGVNNFWALDGAITEHKRTAEQIIPALVHDIQAMVVQAKAHGIIPVICSILPTNMPQSGNNAIRNASICRVNEDLQKVASEHGAIYVDYHSRMVTDDGIQLRNGLADDGLHPHVIGYDIMADALREELKLKGISI
ncbi:GDSL-type esterase/lipase family protein [Paenibacillus qinlingensis]|uniref:Lysophospholipase L1-like esterase n=1 Tax=Paenibacillus qinlingensis TaxID=1837343 RepID=A0ABU1NT30_9BACL|nr:GDSL-type esterase/lipase family protein [Paenibacillus qinlingensis]MDR6550610.1 lysophospholipase L1-like esterase [Paenibacillus qinlingensis]